jgi:hypothetical protein
MHLGESIQDRQQNLLQGFLRQRAGTLDVAGERFAFGVLHHDVTRAVRLEIANDLHDVRVLELRQCAGFVEKALEPPTEGLPVLRRLRYDRGLALAHCEVDGQVFLDGNRLLQVGVEREIGDPEPAGAEQFEQPVLLKLEPFRKREQVVGHHEPDPAGAVTASSTVVLSWSGTRSAPTAASNAAAATAGSSAAWAASISAIRLSERDSKPSLASSTQSPARSGSGYGGVSISRIASPVRADRST